MVLDFLSVRAPKGREGPTPDVSSTVDTPHDP